MLLIKLQSLRNRKFFWKKVQHFGVEAQAGDPNCHQQERQQPPPKTGGLHGFFISLTAGRRREPFSETWSDALERVIFSPVVTTLIQVYKLVEVQQRPAEFG